MRTWGGPGTGSYCPDDRARIVLTISLGSRNRRSGGGGHGQYSIRIYLQHRVYFHRAPATVHRRQCPSCLLWQVYGTFYVGEIFNRKHLRHLSIWFTVQSLTSCKSNWPKKCFNPRQKSISINIKDQMVSKYSAVKILPYMELIYWLTHTYFNLTYPGQTSVKLCCPKCKWEWLLTRAVND